MCPESCQAERFIRGSNGDEMAAIENDDAIVIEQSIQPVGDGDDGAVGKRRSQQRLHSDVRLRVYVRRRFVDQHDLKFDEIRYSQFFPIIKRKVRYITSEMVERL